MKKVFISYRREDTRAIAGRLYDGLEARLGADTVFFDIDSIPLGSDFREHVRTTLDHCGVLLVLIGAHWLDPASDGRRRLDDPNDLMRVEIEAALERRIPVVPVLIDQTAMPSSDQLPAELAALVYRNAVRVDSGIDFRNHLARLVAGILPLIEPVAAHAPFGVGASPAIDSSTPTAALTTTAPVPTPAAETVSNPSTSLPATPRPAKVALSEAIQLPRRLWAFMNWVLRRRALVPADAPAISITREATTTVLTTALLAWRTPLIAAAVALLMLSIVYVVVSLELAGMVDQVDASLHQLRVPPTPATAPLVDDLTRVLQQDIDAGRVSVRVGPANSVLLLRSDPLFAAGSATLEASGASLLERVAVALRNRTAVGVFVTVHTDDQPIRSLRFASNFQLSVARARAVADVLIQGGVPAGRVRAEGRGDSEPLTPNDSAASRASNRRVEILLQSNATDRPAGTGKGSS